MTTTTYLVGGILIVVGIVLLVFVALTRKVIDRELRKPQEEDDV